MYITSMKKRMISMFLCAAMLLSLLPASVLAVEGETVAGTEETISVSTQAGRERSFNEGWKFYLGTSGTAQNPSFDDSGWKAVNLPHDFSITQSFITSGEAESGFLPGGTGWYRKSFVMPASDAGKTVLLNFDGVYSDAYVYVNGTLVGEHHYGYTAFAFDISQYLTFDGATENVVAVKAVNNIPSSRWYSGSGIYRDVTMLVMDPVHVDLNGTYVTTPNISNGIGTVNVETTVVNDDNTDATVVVKNTVYDAAGNSVATAESQVTVSANSSTVATSAPVVPSPSLWSIDHPTLYTVRTELYVSDSQSASSTAGSLTASRKAGVTVGTPVDTYDTTFGFRYYSFDSTGFHLNGQNVKLNGVCLHHDQGALGSAAYYDAMYRQLSKMKDMGANAIRTSHNPADEDFIDICNELGLLVIEEAFDGWSVSKNGNSNDFGKYFNTSLSSSNGIYGGDSSMTWAEYAIKSMVKRDRNDPAVILWSLGNEIQEGASADSSFPTIAKNLIDWIKEVDTTRPSTIGDNTKSTGTGSVLGRVLNVITDNGGIAGFNYANNAGTLNSLAQSYDGVVIASETSSAINSRSIYTSQASATNADGKYHLTSYDTSSVGWGITAHDSIYNTYQYDCVAGEFVWTGFDYLGEPTPWNGTGSGSVSGAGAIPNSSYFGIVETTGFEKDTYYLYRSQWNQAATTLHLVTAWDSDNMMTSSGKTPVVIYSNAPVVKLYRNGDLIGTATRTAKTSSAGHTYYTYSTESESSSICTAVSASGSASLYATFNVTFAEGTISAKAFEANGTTEIALDGNSGKHTVSTPGSVSKLNVTQNKTEIAADGSSLAYITVDVTDASGNLDTTATNTINFTLTGNGEIVGVDNGDQATTAKYQQSSVLTSATSANIAAYAGKALVIVRSTKDAGTFTVNATASGLTGGSATVTTTAVDNGEATTGLTSYTLVRDYTVKVGTAPALGTTATGTLVDGTTVNGTIVWEEIPADTYNTVGDYTINGSLTFEGLEPITVICRLHVLADVIAMRNIATATTPNIVPTLPTTVSGVLADGTLSGEFQVTWDSMTEDQFATVDTVVTVNGTAKVLGDSTLPVTASVRVAEAVNTESTNVAASATLTQDCASASDNLSSITDGAFSNASDTNARWTNYNNRNTSDTATITFTWATAQLISSVNLYYFTDNYSASLPSSVAFEYSLNGTDFTAIDYEDVTPAGGFTKTEYVFSNVINPIALRVILTEQSGRCVGLTEAEIMTFAGSLEYNTSADLSGITVDGTAIDGFAADTLEYAATGTNVAAATTVNAGITVLPAKDNVVRILTISEDGTASKTYAVTLTGAAVCDHANTEIRNALEATCTAEGYTGDTYCTDCGAKIADGTVIPAKGHSETITQNASPATCTEDGYTGDQVCTVCGEVVTAGTVIPATGHATERRNAKEATCGDGYTGDLVCTVCGAVVEAGTVIPGSGEHTPAAPTDVHEATCTESGYTGTICCEICGVVIEYGTNTPMLGHTWDAGVVNADQTKKIYTCTKCGATKEESYSTNKAPSVSVSAARNGTKKITLTGAIEDYENVKNQNGYYEVTGRGLVYYSTAKLGTRSLTVNTPGRTRVSFKSVNGDGTYSYTMTPAYATTKYTVRAYVIYTNKDGKSVYVYSDPIIVSYNGLS